MHGVEPAGGAVTPAHAIDTGGAVTTVRLPGARGARSGRTEIHHGAQALAGARRLTLEPGYLQRLDRGRWIVVYIDRSADGSELWIGVHVQGQRDHLKWFSGLHPFGKSFCVGASEHAVSHIETHYDEQGRVRGVVLDVL